ncbi:MAG: peptidoglycan DD-metalloendopeptidase family protein [Candidatus Limivicinus sp.]
MSSNSSGGKLERFFTGKGFYIVLFLCAAVIGVSAWMLAAGNKTMSKDDGIGEPGFDTRRVETVVITPAPRDVTEVNGMEEPETEETAAEDGIPENAVEVFEDSAREAAAPSYIWPVSGNVERSHGLDELKYDVTMRDWRTHNGIDIESPLGTTVMASRGGVVESITQDDLYGTVVCISHGDGSRAIYANLADTPAVSVNDAVEAGSVIGAVGSTAICEAGQGNHLHFAMSVNGESVDPMEYLPA